MRRLLATTITAATFTRRAALAAGRTPRTIIALARFSAVNLFKHSVGAGCSWVCLALGLVPFFGLFLLFFGQFALALLKRVIGFGHGGP
jgi:hypothetical protein